MGGVILRTIASPRCRICRKYKTSFKTCKLLKGIKGQSIASDVFSGDNVKLIEGGIGVYGDAVLDNFSCGISVISILTCGIAVLSRSSVCGFSSVLNDGIQ